MPAGDSGDDNQMPIEGDVSYIDDGDDPPEDDDPIDEDDPPDDDDPPEDDDQDEPQASDVSQSDDASQTSSIPQGSITDQASQITPLPKSFRMSAAMVNEVSHTRKAARSREKRIQQNQNVQYALTEISNPENSLSNASTIDDINVAHKARTEHRDTLQEFESSNSRLKQLHTQRLRTKRTWAMLCAAERRHARRHVLEASTTTSPSASTGSASTTPGSSMIAGPSTASTSATSATVSTVSAADGWCTLCNRHHIPNEPEFKTFRHVAQCPKSQPQVRPVLLIGEAGTGVGSRIGGYQRRGGGKMREQHRRYCTVGMTNEFRTSKTCIYCYCQVRQARARRLVNGKVKFVNLHDAVECINPECPSVKQGYTVKPRDAHAAAAIAIAGASALLDRSRRTLPPFSRNTKPPSRNATTNTSQALAYSSSSQQASAM